jgi:hypothetical protein
MATEEQTREANRAASTMFNLFPQGAFSGPTPTGFGFGQTPFATSQSSSGTATPPLEGFRSPFEGVALIGRRDPAPPQFPADRYDPLKGSPITTASFQPRTTNAASISQADAIAQSNANMTENQRRGYGLLSLSPSSADVAMAVYRGAPSGIAGGVAPTTFSPSFDQGIASSRYGIAQSPNQTPMAPVSTNIAGATERRGVQTAYGMIYPAAGQEAGAERSAALGPMGARYANVRQESNQADKIARMRERGAAIGQSLVNRQEAYFAQKQAERRALGAAESAARTAGASSMDVMRSRSAANKSPSSIGGIQQEFASYQPVVGPVAPTSLYASGAATRFTESLPAGGFSSPRSGPMGLSGTDLYRQQQRDKMARGESGAFSNARSRQRKTTRGIARSQGIAPATNYSSQLDQEEYFRRRNLA